MDSSTLLIIAGAFLFNIVIMIFVISSATQTKRRLYQNDLNNRLLILVAKKLNATEDEINEAINS